MHLSQTEDVTWFIRSLVVQKQCNMNQTTSQKHTAFVSEPMGNKHVRYLAGIEKTVGENLASNGIDKAYLVLANYLIVGKSTYQFEKWLKEKSGADRKQCSDCSRCLSDWCDAHL